MSFIKDPLGPTDPLELYDDKFYTTTQNTQYSTGMLRSELNDNSVDEGQDRSAVGDLFDATPLVIPVRAHIDSVRRLLKGDIYIGRGS